LGRGENVSGGGWKGELKEAGKMGKWNKRGKKKEGRVKAP